jgi:hypothetical protein
MFISPFLFCLMLLNILSCIYGLFETSSDNCALALINLHGSVYLILRYNSVHIKGTVNCFLKVDVKPRGTVI